jgi:Fe-S cluster biogenesis protein NfuA
MFTRVQKILDEKVKPHLAEHHGNVELLEAKDGVVKIKLLGQCSGCPSAKYTVEDLIETTLKQEIPEIKEVILDNEVSKELWDMAKKILKQRNENK